jgi:phosphate:Na+ symporter
VFNVQNLVYPAFFAGIILIYMKKRRIIGDFLFGVAFLFLGLGTLKETGFSLVDDPQANAAISAFFQKFNETSFWSSFFFLFMGTLLTLCVQSSAAIMAITMTLCSTGVLHIDQGIMLVLGENIGTTITANIVAIGTTTQARRAAFAHLSINVLGVTWALILLQPFVNLICSFVGFDRTIQPGDAGYAANLAKISFVLATFHSTFNVTNTLLQIWFIPQIERFVCKVIKPKNSEEEEDFRWLWRRERARGGKLVAVATVHPAASLNPLATSPCRIIRPKVRADKPAGPDFPVCPGAGLSGFLENSRTPEIMPIFCWLFA